MKKKRLFYLVITILFIILTFELLKHTNLQDNIALSKIIEIILILYLIRIAYGCTIFIREQYQKHKYSYSIIMNVGLLIFIVLNILRLANLLIANWHELSITDIYNNTLESFSYFAMLTLPCIIILSIYSIITNIVLIKKEGFKPRNLLGIILGVLAIFGLLSSQTIYFLTKSIFKGTTRIITKKALDMLINITLSYLYTLIIATLYCNIMAAKHTPKYEQDYIIILGSKIKEDGTLTPLLKGRVDKAIEFAKKQKNESNKDIYYVPSGGKGNDEVIAEAEAIKNYLIEQGVSKTRIIIEDKSKSTQENMKFSKKIINEKQKDANICFSTTNYHVFRSGVIANECGLDCEGMGSRTKWYFYSNALIREFIANLVQEKRKHIALLVLIYLLTFIFIYIGYYYQLISLQDILMS